MCHMRAIDGSHSNPLRYKIKKKFEISIASYGAVYCSALSFPYFFKIVLPPV